MSIVWGAKTLSKELDSLASLTLYPFRAQILNRSVTEYFEGYKINEAMRLFTPFLDTLNNWYIRRSRERVWSEDPRAREDGFLCDPLRCANSYITAARTTMSLYF